MKLHRFTIYLLQFSVVTLPALAQDTEIYDLHFTVLSGRERVVAAATEENFRKQIDLLNAHFRSAGGELLARFRLHSVSYFNDIKDSHCQKLIKRANSPVHTARSGDVYSGEPGICSDTRIFHPGMINVFIIDTYTREKGWDAMTCFGNVHNYQPYIALDYAWLSARPSDRIPIIVHEMGHAFGLQDEKSRGDNVMESGSQTVYFSDEQVQIMKNAAAKIRRNLAQYDAANLILNPGFEFQRTYWEFSKGNFSQRFAYAGDWSAEILPGQKISQSVVIHAGGTFSFAFVAQAYRPGAIVSFMVNGEERFRYEVRPGKDKDYNAYTTDGIQLNSGDTVVISITSTSIGRFDDFVLRRKR